MLSIPTKKTYFGGGRCGGPVGYFGQHPSFCFVLSIRRKYRKYIYDSFIFYVNRVYMNAELFRWLFLPNVRADYFFLYKVNLSESTNCLASLNIREREREREKEACQINVESCKPLERSISSKTFIWGPIKINSSPSLPTSGKARIAILGIRGNFAKISRGLRHGPQLSRRVAKINFS